MSQKRTLLRLCPTAACTSEEGIGQPGEPSGSPGAQDAISGRRNAARVEGGAAQAIERLPGSTWIRAARSGRGWTAAES